MVEEKKKVAAEAGSGGAGATAGKSRRTLRAGAEGEDVRAMQVSVVVRRPLVLARIRVARRACVWVGASAEVVRCHGPAQMCSCSGTPVTVIVTRAMLSTRPYFSVEFLHHLQSNS